MESDTIRYPLNTNMELKNYPKYLKPFGFEYDSELSVFLKDTENTKETIEDNEINKKITWQQYRDDLPISRKSFQSGDELLAFLDRKKNFRKEAPSINVHPAKAIRMMMGNWGLGLSHEDIDKYATEDEKKILLEEKNFPVKKFKTAKNVIDRILKKYNMTEPYEVRLIGSWAKGTARPDSDIDILISSTKKGKKFITSFDISEDLERSLAHAFGTRDARSVGIDIKVDEQ